MTLEKKCDSEKRERRRWKMLQLNCDYMFSNKLSYTIALKMLYFCTNIGLSCLSFDSHLCTSQFSFSFLEAISLSTRIKDLLFCYNFIKFLISSLIESSVYYWKFEIHSWELFSLFFLKCIKIRCILKINYKKNKAKIRKQNCKKNLQVTWY